MKNNKLYKYNELLDFYTELTSEKEKLAKIILNLLPKNRDKYLDVGSGNGQLMSFLINEFNYIEAIESNKMFSKRLKLITNNITWGKIEEINLYKKFDFILASHVLGYISNELKPQVLKKIYEVMNKNGVLVFVYNSIKSDIFKILDIVNKNTLNKSNYSKTIINSSLWKEKNTSPFIVFEVKFPIQCTSESCIRNIINFLAFKDINKADNKCEILNDTSEQFIENSNLWTINVIHEFLVVSHDLNIIERIRNKYSQSVLSIKQYDI